MAPPAYSSFFSPEGWESVGVTYSSFFGPEGWESPISYTSFFSPEGWETVFTEADHITVSLSPTPSLTGETVTVSGRVTRGRLNPTAENGVTVTVEVYDDSEELLQSVEATTDASGDYSVDVTLKRQAAAFVRVTTNRKGAIVPFGGSAVEGWES